ncbi:hypothetical protein [Trichothermofontia sp.]
MAKRTNQTKKKVDLDCPCFSQLHDFYRHNRGHIHTHYRELSRKSLDFNDPDHNPRAFRRQPQFSTLAMSVCSGNRA